MDGEYGKSASLWLADMERHREEGSSPSMYLQHIDRHLEGQAAKWVLNTPNVRLLIYRGYMDSATEFVVEAFHEALSNHFKLTNEDVIDSFNADATSLIDKLKQRSSESLEDYYGRAREVLLALHGRDGQNDTLTPQEISLRWIVVGWFVSGLCGEMLRDEVYQQHVLHHTVSLYQAFKMAKAASKIMEKEMEAKTRKAVEQKNNRNKKRRLADYGTDSEEKIKDEEEEEEEEEAEKKDKNKKQQQQHKLAKSELPFHHKNQCFSSKVSSSRETNCWSRRCRQSPAGSRNRHPSVCIPSKEKI